MAEIFRKRSIWLMGDYTREGIRNAAEALIDLFGSCHPDDPIETGDPKRDNLGNMALDLLRHAAESIKVDLAEIYLEIDKERGGIYSMIDED